MKLFQSIFGGRESVGRYPETLIDMAIERAVDGTDSRLRLVPGYRKRLREPVMHAIDQVVALVDGIPAPVAAGSDDYRNDFRLAALFASAEDMLQVFGRDRALSEYLSGAEGQGTERVTALLLARREERNILGMELVGDQVRRDVAQVTVSFSGHHLLEPRTSEEECRRFLKRRAFDHLLALALAQITEARVERADLTRQRDLLLRKLQAMKRGTLSIRSAGRGSSRRGRPASGARRRLATTAGAGSGCGRAEGPSGGGRRAPRGGGAPGLVTKGQPLPEPHEHPARSR